MLAVHKTHSLDYVDAEGHTMERVTDSVVVKKNKHGAYVKAFCFCCGTYINFTGLLAQHKLSAAKTHICRDRQSHKPGMSVPDGTPKPAKPPKSILKTILNHPKFAGSRAKLEEEYGDLLDDPEADEIEDFVVPWMADLYGDAVEAEPIRNALAETISNLKTEKHKLEDFIEQLKTSSSAKEKDLTERMYALSKQVTEEASLRHAAEARLKGAPVAVPAPAIEKIEIVDERTPVQWSLLYQG